MPRTALIHSDLDKFKNRGIEIEEILGCVHRNINVVIVGNPSIGKTSLIMRLQRELQLISEVPTGVKQIIITLDGLSFPYDATPAYFWRKNIIAQAIRISPELGAHFQPILSSNDDRLDNNVLVQCFTELASANFRIVALIDEFDRLLGINTLIVQGFLDLFQAVAEKTRGFCFVCATRITPEELHDELLKRQEELKTVVTEKYGQPFSAYTLSLRGLSSEGVESVLEPLPKTLHVGSRVLTGNHPGLLHLLGERLWHIRDEPSINWEARLKAFVSDTSELFHQMWNNLKPDAQVALAIIVLRDYAGIIKDHLVYETKDLSTDLIPYWDEIDYLEKRGIVTLDSNDQPRIDAIGFQTWIAQSILADADKFQSVEELISARFKVGGVVTKQRLDSFKDFANKVAPKITEIAFKVAMDRIAPAPSGNSKGDD